MAKSPRRRATSMKQAPERGGAAGNSTSISISSGSSAVVSAPTKKSARGDPSLALAPTARAAGRRARARWPAFRRPDRRARGCRRWCRGCGFADGRYAAALRAIERQMRAVPRDRARGRGSASARRSAAAAGSVARPRHSSVSGLMSISTAGWVSRKFIVGTRLWPPARKRASSPCSAFSCKRLLERPGGDVPERRGLHACGQWQKSAAVRARTKYGKASRQGKSKRFSPPAAGSWRNTAFRILGMNCLPNILSA